MDCEQLVMLTIQITNANINIHPYLLNMNIHVNNRQHRYQNKCQSMCQNKCQSNQSIDLCKNSYNFQYSSLRMPNYIP